ncbi:MAG: hypothetical protein ACFFCI_22005 [Promethearchaeota archaeon]
MIIIDDYKRKDLDEKFLKAFVSELCEEENEYNSDIILKVSKQVMSREMSPFEAMEIIEKKSIKRMKKTKPKK